MLRPIDDDGQLSSEARYVRRRILAPPATDLRPLTEGTRCTTFRGARDILHSIPEPSGRQPGGFHFYGDDGGGRSCGLPIQREGRECVEEAFKISFQNERASPALADDQPAGANLAVKFIASDAREP